MWRCGEVCLVRRRGVFLYATFFRCMVCMWSSSFGICIPFSNSPIKRGRVINIILPSSQKAITKIRVRPCYIKKIKINRKKKSREKKRDCFLPSVHLGCMHIICSFPECLHFLPLFCGAGLSQGLLRTWTPSLHLREHFPHWDHAPQWPSIFAEKVPKKLPVRIIIIIVIATFL